MRDERESRRLGCGDRASRGRECGGTTEPAPGAPQTLVAIGSVTGIGAPKRPVTGIGSREEATAPATARREREPPNATCAVRASRRQGRAAAERHETAGAAERLSRRQERQRGAAGSGAVDAARRRPSLERKQPRRRKTRRGASCRALRAPRERAAAERHTTASAAVRPGRRQERQRGAAGSGTVGVAPPCRRPHAESASRQALRATKERAAATEERR